MDSSSLSHTRYKCQYHIVFIPKYRKRIMYGRLKADVREIIKKLCDYRNIEIVEGAVCADHVQFVFKHSAKRKSVRCGRVHKRKKCINDTR